MHGSAESCCQHRRLWDAAHLDSHDALGLLQDFSTTQRKATDEASKV